MVVWAANRLAPPAAFHQQDQRERALNRNTYEQVTCVRQHSIDELLAKG
jgi:hypothetical protein